ncbi:MAG: hypothetical protein K6F97_12685 [Lachnospiraceae bacterium]|nr:hypothetical protein [Lachnospiraceae bacterium]
MRIKRFLATTLGAALIAGMVFTGCGSKKDGADKADVTTIATEDAATEEGTTEGDTSEDATTGDKAAEGTTEKEKSSSESKEEEKKSESKTEEKSAKKENNKSNSAETKNVKEGKKTGSADTETDEATADDLEEKKKLLEERYASISDYYSKVGVCIDGDGYEGDFIDNSCEAFMTVTADPKDETKLNYEIQISKTPTSYYSYSFDSTISPFGSEIFKYNNCVEKICTTKDDPAGESETIVAENLTGEIEFVWPEQCYKWRCFDHGFPGFIFECVDVYFFEDTDDSSSEEEEDEDRYVFDGVIETYEYDDYLEMCHDERESVEVDRDYEGEDHLEQLDFLDANTFAGEYVDKESKGKLVATTVPENDSIVHISIRADVTSTSYYNYEFDIDITDDTLMYYHNYTETYVTTAEDPKGASETVTYIDKGGYLKFYYGDTFIWAYFKHDLPGFIFSKVK